MEKMYDIKNLFKEKENCYNNISNPKIIKTFYDKLHNLSLIELKDLFPVPEDTISQKVFDCTNEMIAAPTIKTAIKSSMILFSKKTLTECSQRPYQNDMRLLQALFFFLIEEITTNSREKNTKIFEEAIQEGSWYSSDKQTELLNKLAEDLHFYRKDFFTKTDFNSLGHKHFNGNECVLRLFYNFMHPSLYAKEGIVNELNFVREQQTNILPVIPNTKKTNYKEPAAKKEIERKNENLATLKNLDFGFHDAGYRQSFFMCDERLKHPFLRPINCKCFTESELEWDKEPYFDTKSDPRKIKAPKSIRKANDSQLKCKFLYSERNIITHSGENAAIYRLLIREYHGEEKKKWYKLMLESMYDIREYLRSFPQKSEGEKLTSILNYYLKHITNELNMNNLPPEERWARIFDENGNVKLNEEDQRKTDLFNILTDDEFTHFKRFLGLMYCSENDENDFLDRNQLRIQLYLIYLTFEFSKKDK